MFLAPLALLLIGAAGEAAGAGAARDESSIAAGQSPITAWHVPIWHQVRIEQRFSVRITPGTAFMPPAMVEELEEEERVERVEARNFGKCLSVNTIAAVQPGDGDELLLFLRDQRIVTVQLEKHCSSRAFYSGFYVAHNADGAICVGRDILQSRSGTNCKVRRLTELVPSGFRRFP